MSGTLFPGAATCSFGDFALELVPHGAWRNPELLASLRGDVFRVAAASRGWEEPRDLERMRRTFKIGPLFAADGLALVRREGRLVGLVGTVNDWHVDEGSIVHLCSLGLLPEAQNRGFLQVLLALMWPVSLRDPVLARNCRAGRAYVSAITQSPYILALLDQTFDTFPSPGRAAPDAEMAAVARRVVERFDPEVAWDPATFVLRNECDFRYRRVPWSRDRAVNRMCRERLRLDEGDVFVAVGRVEPARLERLSALAERRFSDLFRAVAAQPPWSQPTRGDELPLLGALAGVGA